VIQLARILAALMLALLSLGALLVLVYTGLVYRDLPRLPERLEELDPPRQTVILDRAGRVLARIGTSEPVDLDRISPLFIDALLAAEDSDFHRHHGIDKRSLVRLLLDNLVRGRRIGGSTITQQLVKNHFFSFKKEVDRKLREMLLAAQFESRYGKREILQAYCNTINFGSGCLGVESAAREYFGKTAAALALEEAATLVAVLNAPGRFHPRIRPDNCRNRRNWVLSRMETLGMVDQATALRAAESPVSVLPGRRFENGHLRDYVLSILRESYEERGYDPGVIPYAGLVIHTSVDSRLQDLAQREVTRRCAEIEKRLAGADPLQGAFVAMDPLNGEVLAIVGGRDYGESAFNCATGPNRQPGSSFKPLTYYTALRAGRSPLDVVVDSVEVFDVGYGQTWEPGNWDDNQHGPVTLAYGVIHSLNVVMAKTVMQMDPDELVENARTAGIDSPLKPVPSLALGALACSPIELATVYSTFANRGIRSAPQIVRWVEDQHGQRVLAFRPEQRQALDPVECYLVVDVLQQAVRRGTGISLREAGYPGELGGKTGTTNDYRDSWFCSVMPNLCTVSWIGHLDNRPMRINRVAGITGAGGALKIFKGLLPEIERLYYDSQVFRIPEEIEFRKVDLVTGGEDESGVRLALRMIDY